MSHSGPNFSPVLLDVTDDIATLTLNRPSQANSINLDLALAFQSGVDRICADTDIRAIRIRANGNMFCSGGDLQFFSENAKNLSHLLPQLIDAFHDGLWKLAAQERPILVEVQGSVGGGGLSLVCIADLAISAPNTKFALGYGAIGFSPDTGLSYLLPQLLGARRAMAFGLLNTPLTAKQAETFGLITSVVADGEFRTVCDGTMRHLRSAAQTAQRDMRRLMHCIDLTGFREALDREKALVIKNATSRDGLEGVSAFLEKRAPNFL